MNKYEGKKNNKISLKAVIVNIFIAVIILFAIFLIIESTTRRAGTFKVNSISSFYEEEYTYQSAFSRDEKSYVCRVNNLGKIDKIYEEDDDKLTEPTEYMIIDDVFCYKDRVYVFSEAENANEDEMFYKLTCLDQDLKYIYSILDNQFNYDDMPSHMYIVNNTVYMTMLSASRQTANVYALQLDGDDHSWYKLLEQQADENRFFIEAIFDGSGVKAGYDNGSYVYFQADSSVKMTEDINPLLHEDKMIERYPIKESSLFIFLRLVKGIILKNIIGAIVVGSIIALLFAWLTGASYRNKQFALLEIALLALVALFTIISLRYSKVEMKREYLNSLEICFTNFNEDFSDENAFFLDAMDYYNSQDYGKAYLSFAKFGKQMKHINELMLVYVDGYNEQVMLALNNYRDYAQANVLNYDIEELIKKAGEKSSIQNKIIEVDGTKCGVFVVPVNDKLLIKKYIVSVVYLDDINYLSKRFETVVFIIDILAFALLTAFAWILTKIILKDIKSFGKAMLTLSEEELLSQKPEIATIEMSRLWNSLQDMVRRYEKISRAKTTMMEAYNRFSPRMIESIMGKKAITDVKIGDSVVINATMAHLAIMDSNLDTDIVYMYNLDIVTEILGKIKEENEGIVVGHDSGLNSIKMLFINEPEYAIDFAVNTTIELRNKFDENIIFFALIHTGKYMYGVTGSDNEAFIYVGSKESELLEKYITPFKERNAGIIITGNDPAYDKNKSLRYIGYAKNGEKQIKFYQLLDSFADNKRNLMMMSASAFAEGLDYFYQSQFAEARNKFAEALRIVQDDEIARWYLFKCEDIIDKKVSKISFDIFS